MGRGPFGRGGHGHGRGGGEFWELFAGPPPRAERGVVRYLVLDVVATQPRHGYEIMQTIADRSGGSYRPSPGVIYPTLQLLEELSHVRVEEQEGRKVYAITADGRSDLEAHRTEVEEFYERTGAEDWEQYAEELGDLLRHAARMFKAIRRLSRRGLLKPSTIKKLRAIVDEAVAKIEDLSASD